MFYVVFLQELDTGHVFNACLVLGVLHKCGEMLVFPGGRGISVMVSQGLVKKMSTSLFIQSLYWTRKFNIV